MHLRPTYACISIIMFNIKSNNLTKIYDMVMLITVKNACNKLTSMDIKYNYLMKLKFRYKVKINGLMQFSTYFSRIM